MNLTRTQDEIVARIKDPTVEKRDSTGDERSRYLDALDWERAQQFLRPGAHSYTEESWLARQTKTVEQVRELIAAHVSHAWRKANERRAVSAVRTLCYFTGLLWLMGSKEADEVARSIEDWDYYGKPQLVMVCELLDLDWRSMDSGQWVTHDGGKVRSADEVLGR